MIGYVSKDDSYLATSTDDINSIKAYDGTKLYLYDKKETKIRIGDQWYDYTLPVSGGGSGVINDKSITTEKFADDAKSPFAGTADIANSVQSKNISDASAVGKSVITAKDAATARSVIGAGTSSFSGSYNDLTNKPTIPTAYTLPAATTMAIGGVKKLTAQADSTATDAAGLVADFNALLAKFRAAGMMES